MIDQSQQNKILQQKSPQFKKKAQQDDTLSLESERSQGFINEKTQDWPSWTVDEHQETQMKNQQVEKVPEAKQNTARVPNVGIVNQSQLKKTIINQIKIPKKRYGRGSLRFQRLRIERQLRLQAQKQQQSQKPNIPIYESKNQQ